jgi:plastocyanin
MARQLVEKYIFTPGAANSGTVKFPGKCDESRLLIIANKTSQENIYALGDPTRNGVVSYDPDDNDSFFSEQSGATTVTLEKDTTAMLSSDTLSVYIDAAQNIGNIVRPYAFGVDSIERMRVSNPQSLIDADFEYGLQPTKWQNYAEIRGVPGIYEKPGLDIFLQNVVTGGESPSVITVTTQVDHGLAINDAVILYGLGGTSAYARAEGAFIVATIPNSTTFTYYAKGVVGVYGISLMTGSTYARRGGFYTGASLPIDTISSDEGNPSVITVTCSDNHGLVPGSPLVGLGLSNGVGHSLLSGNFFAETVPSSTSFTFTSRVGGAVENLNISMGMYTRSDAFVIHRPFDGGVTLGNFVPSHGASVARQTKKYMRYQSGKGVLWTSGVSLNPVLNLDQISANATAVGSIITVSTEMDHGLQIGCQVVISGVVTAGYNGTYGVNTIINENVFTVVAGDELASSDAVITNIPRVTLNSWDGASVRVGPFDDQNGLFWEYDGQELAVVKRSSTFQLSGFVTVTPGSQLVTGTSCRFTQQLQVGNNIVIRGMTYKIGSVTDDNTLTINPEYRGVNQSAGIKIAVIIDTRIPQSEFNIDKIDGTGVSGYKMNLNKMQMLGIGFSWYGAGFIEFMCRGPDGNMIMVHRMKQNNLNDEAYMRTGNSTVRYQSINESVIGRLGASMTDSQDTLVLVDSRRFPNSGTVLVENEVITYTNKTGNTLTGCTRSASFELFAGGVNKTFQGGAATAHDVGNFFNSVTFIGCTATPTLNHWGSSYIMDGGFDIDRGYYFNYGSLNQTIPTGRSKTAFFVRLAPSVSNSISGALGDRDLINRSQLLLQKLQVQSDASVQVYGILNPGNIDAANLTWTSVNTVALGSQPSFAEVSTSSNTAAEPGEQIFSTLGQPNGFSEIDLSQLKELSNSAIGGYSNFPDGPDVLAVVVKNVGFGVTSFEVTSPNSTYYEISGQYNPDLTFYRGQTYTFEIVGSPAHPFFIQTTDGAYNQGTIVTEGITGNGQYNGTLTFTVPLDAPDTLYYVCQNHSAMQGTITIANLNPANVNINLFWSEAQA